MFEVGQKVVCINDRFPPQFFEWGDRTPSEGEVYTIREIAECPHGITRKVEPAVLLEEIVNPSVGGHPEVMFNADRFRPLEPGRAEEKEEETSVAGTAQRVS